MTRPRRIRPQRRGPRAGVVRALEAAWARHRAGDLAAAERGYRRVLALDPGNASALQHLAAFERGRGELGSALARLLKAVTSVPGDASCRSNLANLLQESGRPAEALAHYREALRLAPGHLPARFNLGKALQRLGDFEAAVACFEALCALAPEDPGAWCALGLAQHDAHRAQAALGSQRRALALDPALPDAHDAIGALFMERGAFAEAEAAFRTALRHAPDYAPAFGNLVRARRMGAEDRPLVARMRTLLEGDGLAPGHAADLHFALAKTHEDLAEYDRAFVHYREGNRRRRGARRHDREAAAAQVRTLAATFDPAFFARTAGRGDPDPRPVFITGMPRSGTSLVEQILASHPECFGAGELPHLERVVRSRPAGAGGGSSLPALAAGLGGADLRALGRAYLEALPAEAGAAARVTDKMPPNWRYLGFAAAILPGARVIHCRRDAMDVCFSIYAQPFTHRDAWPWAYDLRDLASEYLDCERLMAHWARTLPLPMHAVRYERLVRDPEAVTRELLAFCGLPFDARCLRFHESERPVRTASDWQVRQPLYRSSVGRWRRFESHLAPLREALEGGGAGGQVDAAAPSRPGRPCVRRSRGG